MTILVSFLQIDEQMGGMTSAWTWFKSPYSQSLKLLSLVVSHCDIFLSVLYVDFMVVR